MGHESEQTLLEGSKAAFDLALGLWGGSDQVGDVEGAQGALELAFGVGVVAARTRPEKAQAVGVDDLGNAVGLERLAEVEEVVPCRVGGDEAARHVEAGMIVDGEQERLFAGGGPPLVDGAVVLPKFADGGAAEPAIDTLLSGRERYQVGEVKFDVGLDARTRPNKSTEAFQLVGDKLKVRRVLNGQEAFEKGVDLGGPEAAVVASARFRAVGVTTGEPGGLHAVELGSADTQLGGGGLGVQEAVVESVECLEDELRWQAVDDLLLFKSA